MAEPTADTQQAPKGLTRRAFLGRVALGAAAVVGLGILARRAASHRDHDTLELHPDQDSIFTPRADQRDPVLGRRRT